MTGSRVIVVIARGIARLLLTAAKSIGAQDGKHTHDLDGQASLYRTRDEYRP